MTQTHYRGLKMPYGIKTTPYWSAAPVGKLLIFVHGFRGNALTTWSDFTSLMQDDPRYRGYDVVFYGYDGFRTRAGISAANLHKFLNDLLSNVSQQIKPYLSPGLHRPGAFDYSRVLLVGHSLGAVVIRRALLDAHDRNRPWAQKSEMAFFAPAHCGADIIELAAQAAFAVPYVGRLLVPAVKLTAKSLRDLSTGCAMLVKLRVDTDAAYKAGNAKILAKAIWFGDQENVVQPVGFSHDPPFEPPFPNRGHIDLCKPRKGFLTPLDEVGRLL